jgi:mannose-1-phosphate guanylyltransferase
VDTGTYFWNSGMFMWSLAAFERALAAYCPDLHAMRLALTPAVGRPDFAGALARAYAPLKRISVDYAIMEHAPNIVVARGTFAWDDVGTWPALAGHFEADAAGNVCLGECALLEAAENVVVSPDRFTALLGVRDLVVVQAAGATLVCPKSRAQDVKKLVQALAADPRRRHLL